MATAALGAVALLGVPLASATAAPMSTPASAMQEDLQPEATSPDAYQFGAILAGLSGEQLEITFLAAIIPHHQLGIEMAQLELERGTSPDIRTHAETIISSQKAQVEQFTRWLKEWYGLTPEQAMAQAPKEAQDLMKKMDEEARAANEELRHVDPGADFDVEFVKRIIPHHASAVIEFLEPQSRAVHAELRVAAATGINSQSAQIADFRTWLSGQTEK